VGDTESVGVTNMNRAQAALGAGRPGEALRLASDALEAWAPLKDPSHLALCFDVLAYGLAQRDARSAAFLLGAADSFRQGIGAELDELERMVREHAEQALAEASDEGIEAERARGRAATLDEAVEEALSVTQR
jgi:hypothetical protein